MKKTSTSNDMQPLTYNAESLRQALCCGRNTAERIAHEAGAVIKIGKRVLYDRRKIEAYLEQREG